MTILKIFEKVNLVAPIEQRRFFNYYEDSVNELEASYGDFLFKEKNKRMPEKLSDDCILLPLYAAAVCDNILFLAGAGESFKSEFIRKSHEAYLKYWRDNAKGRHVKKGEW